MSLPGTVNNKKKHRISVKNLIDICLKHGDLSGEYVSRTRALDGIREHTRVQGLRPESYTREVAVSCTIHGQGFDLEVYGRIDGIFEADEPVTIEEIKSCRKPAGELAQNPAPLHMAQLKCYGYMLAAQRKLDQVNLQITYARIGTQTIAHSKKAWTFEALSVFFNELTREYIRRLEDGVHWREKRNQSIAALEFPYPDFRPGQRQLAESVYKVVKNNRILFARAPTGTGKTIATLFPAVKALGLGHIDKIFYLTAKTVGRTVAVKAIRDMRKTGLKIKHVVITAKQKICFVSDEICDPDTCPYATGYYGKLASAMPGISRYDDFDRERIENLAREYEICPFELSLDVSLICDVIICDLNYCFDPRVYLKRYFDQDSPGCTFLIDEAHNLHDRLRSMYSAHILKSDILSTQKLVRDAAPELSKCLVAINRIMLKLKNQCIDENTSHLKLENPPDDLISQIRLFAGKADRWLDQNREESQIRSALLDFYFQMNIFLVIEGFYDTNYQFYVERIGENDLVAKFFCLDPSPIFSDLIFRCRSAIFFSATLTPIGYHREMLLNNTIEPFTIDLATPFARENLGLFLHPGIRTAYKTRARYYDKIAELIAHATRIRPGNYMVYFPSYAFLNEVLSRMDETVQDDIQVQSPNMTETERKDFLNGFTPDSRITGFAVMGGIFGEGIDLTADRLIGAVVVSPAVPQVCLERDLIKDYYDAIDNSGFFKSYQIPGFNRVLQAAGRVIRTDTDKGIVILVDDRFNRPDYRMLFPPEWQDVRVLPDTDSVVREISAFWKKDLP